MTIGDPVYMDDIDTWPDDFRMVALDAKQLAINFQTARHELLRRRMDGDLEADFEVNPHQCRYDARA